MSISKSKYNALPTMEIHDIVTSYRTAKNPQKQIDVLAQLNGMLPARMAWILSRCGCDVDQRKMPRKSPKTAPMIDAWAESELARECDEYMERQKQQEINEAEYNEIITRESKTKGHEPMSEFFEAVEAIEAAEPEAIPEVPAVILQDVSESEPDPLKDTALVLLERSQVENLIEFFEIALLPMIRNDVEIDNINYVVDMCDIYRRLQIEKEAMDRRNGKHE